MKRVASVSVSGALKVAEVKKLGALPPPSTVLRSVASNRSVGALVFISTAPPTTLRPNSTPCGPRKTSMLSRSKASYSMTEFVPI